MKPNQDRIVSSSSWFQESLGNGVGNRNRGPLNLDVTGNVDSDVVDAYWKYGYYVLEDVISRTEMKELQLEFDELLKRVPKGSGCASDSMGRPLAFNEQQRKLFRFVKPLTDPYGETDTAGGRYQVKMREPALPRDTPREVLLQIGGILQFMESALRIYGHPRLLALAEAINGPDFTPFTEVIWLKQPHFGAAVSWHQDGTTHWDSPGLDQGTHGFNFMVNLHETTPENSLWVVPGTHKFGKADLKTMMAESGSDHLKGAEPLLCKPGDVAICNRQVVHGSFPNTSNTPRYTFVFGFHRRSSVEGVQGWGGESYSASYIDRSSRLIALAIDARKQHFPREQSYRYRPFDNQPTKTWTPQQRKSELINYQQRAIGI